MKMKVLHTEWSDGWGGQEIRIVEEMTAVRELGIEVFLACREHAQIKKKAEERGIPVFALPFQGNTDFKTIFGLIKIIRKNRIDIVNTHSGKDTWVGGIAAKLSGAKFIRTRHLSNPINSSPFNFINSLADFVFTTGESVREDMIRNNRIDPSKILSIPTGIDERRFTSKCCDREAMRRRFGITSDTIAIGNVAVLRSFKRHDLLIQAFMELIKQYPRIQLLIAGEGVQRPNLERLIREQGLEGRVKLLGHLEQPEELLCALDLFVLSSDSKEGVPQSLIQALMMRLPSVATDVGSVKDLLIEDNFLLIEPGSVQALTQGIGYLLDNPVRRETFAKRASMGMERFTRTTMAARIAEIYRVLLGKP